MRQESISITIEPFFRWRHIGRGLVRFGFNCHRHGQVNRLSLRQAHHGDDTRTPFSSLALESPNPMSESVCGLEYISRLLQQCHIDFPRWKNWGFEPDKTGQNHCNRGSSRELAMFVVLCKPLNIVCCFGGMRQFRRCGWNRMRTTNARVADQPCGTNDLKRLNDSMCTKARLAVVVVVVVGSRRSHVQYCQLTWRTYSVLRYAWFMIDISSIRKGSKCPRQHTINGFRIFRHSYYTEVKYDNLSKYHTFHTFRVMFLKPLRGKEKEQIE